MVVTAWTAWRRWPGIGPPSLWLDDQWVALAVQRMGVADFLFFRPPMPLGFHLLERAVTRALGGGSAALQLVPFASSVLVLPATAVLVRRLTRSYALGVLAACLLAGSQSLALYGVAVKPFASDALVTAGLLLVAERTRRSDGVAWYALLGVTGVLALVFSFPSALVSAPLMFLGLVAARRSRTPVFAAYGIAMAALYLGLLRGASSVALQGYWQAFFVPPGLEGLLRFVSTSGPAIWRDALPAGFGALGWLVAPGLAAMAVHAGSRPVAIFVVLFLAEWLLLSALHVYPFGGGRTDLFALPIVVAVPCCGLAAMASFGSALLARAIDTTALLLGLAALPLVPASIYFPNADAAMVRRTVDASTDGDLIVLNNYAETAVAYYGPWPAEIRRSPGADKLDVTIRRANVVGLRWPANQPESREELAAKLERALGGRPPRVLYLTTQLTRQDAAVDGLIRETIGRHGYVVHDEVSVVFARLLVFALSPAVPSDAPPRAVLRRSVIHPADAHATR